MSKIFAIMPTYDVYKDSGVEWLGDIPKHWDTSRFRNQFTFSKGLNITKENLQDLGVPCVNYGEVHSKYGFELNIDKHSLKCVSEDYLKSSPKSLLNVGDFVFADTSEDIEGSGNFTQLVSKQPTFSGYHTVIVRPINEHCQRFLAYVFDSISYRNQVRKRVKGVKVYTISKGLLKDTNIWFASLPEQKAIADFLDKKTSLIDEAVSVKEQQITLLKERKQILIQNAVTQGLNPNTPMRDSGVEWIGKIPKHWEIKSLKFILKEKLKYGANESGIEYHPELPRYIRITDFSGGGKLNEDTKLSLKWEIGKGYLLNDGDILFARSGATVGKSYQFKKSMSVEKYYAYAGYLIKATPDASQLTSDYLKNYAASDCFTGWRETIFNKATIENIGADKYSQLPVILPPIEEQNGIVAYIETESSKIDQAINLNQQQIEKLKEYKATLINSAVTGKIKVV